MSDFTVAATVDLHEGAISSVRLSSTRIAIGDMRNLTDLERNSIMPKAIPGDPALDREVVQRFGDVRDSLASAVTEVLENGDVLRNLGQDSLDAIEMALRQSRIEIDRALLVFVPRRTVRTRQIVGGAVGPLNRRLAVLESTSSVSHATADSVGDADSEAEALVEMEAASE